MSQAPVRTVNGWQRVCIWDGSGGNCGIFGTYSTLRTTAVAEDQRFSLCKPDDIRAVEVDERYSPVSQLSSRNEVQKTEGRAFAEHRDISTPAMAFLEDYYFSLIYLLVMTVMQTIGFVLPTFCCCRIEDQGRKNPTARVSSLWSGSL